MKNRLYVRKGMLHWKTCDGKFEIQNTKTRVVLDEKGLKTS